MLHLWYWSVDRSVRSDVGQKETFSSCSVDGASEPFCSSTEDEELDCLCGSLCKVFLLLPERVVTIFFFCGFKTFTVFLFLENSAGFWDFVKKNRKWRRRTRKNRWDAKEKLLFANRQWSRKWNDSSSRSCDAFRTRTRRQDGEEVTCQENMSF